MTRDPNDVLKEYETFDGNRDYEAWADRLAEALRQTLAERDHWHTKYDDFYAAVVRDANTEMAGWVRVREERDQLRAELAAYKKVAGGG